jgi:hypothetical protein
VAPAFHRAPAARIPIARAACRARQILAR